MKSINQEVAQILDKHISIQKCLKRGIINSRALARFIITEYQLSHTTDAIISAIRRYDIDSSPTIDVKDNEELFSNMILSTKDNVAKIVVKDSCFKIICKDFLGESILKENCRLIKSKETVTIIVNEKGFDGKIKLFNKEDVIGTQKNLSEIRLHFHKDISSAKGVVARLSGELAVHDINVEYVVYSMPDLLLYVKEKDLVQAHDVLRQIKK